VFNCEFDEYRYYPFDNLTFKYRFEMSHFELKDKEAGVNKVYRFDFYRTLDNEISWKPEVGKMPELDIDFNGTHLEVIHEHKPFKPKNGRETAVHYYPGFTIEIKTVRNPFPKIIRAFLPCIILDIFLH